MSNDLVEIALDKFTDGLLFEKLCCEIMRDEGYHDIIRIGTSGDFGVDAIESVFYEESGRFTIVFQFTLEDYVLGKLHETIDKLHSNKIDFDELILVTRVSLTPQRQQNIRTTAKREYKVNANIYEHSTILNRLSDYSNGIFHRNFPNIQRQIEEMEMSMPVFYYTNSLRESASIRTAIAFRLNPASNRARNSMFDCMVLVIMEAMGKGSFSSMDVSALLSKTLGVEPFPISQIEASLNRLRPEVIFDGGVYSLTSMHKINVDIATIKVNGVTESLISDIVENVIVTAKQNVSISDRKRLERNAKDVLRELFRLNSMQLANMAQPNSTPLQILPQDIEDLVNIAKRQITNEQGELLLASLADTISNPTGEQAQILAGWAKIYLGVALMNLDPLLRECQITRLRNKLFILDTDVVLGILVRENPSYNVYQAMIKSLVSLGVKVVIPNEIIVECANHATRSPRTYGYHKGRLLSMTSDMVQEEVKNLFVRAFYNGIKCNLISREWNYHKYMENYYDPTDPVGMMTEIIKNELPREIVFSSLEKLLDKPINKEELDSVTAKIIDVMRRRTKLESRTDNEEKMLAITDALLMLTSLKMNTNNLRDETRQILWARCYIVTNSFRYITAANELGLSNVISTRPSHLIALLENIGGPVASDTELIKLLENPLLTYVVNNMWADLERLLKNGINLTGKSLVRLKRDLDSSLHKTLMSIEDQDGVVDESTESEERRLEDFVELMSNAEKLGYEIHPLALKARDAFSVRDAQDQKIKELENRLQEFEEIIAQFGKKKQRYLRRIQQGRKR